MENQQYFAVIQKNPSRPHHQSSDAATIYPEVHYVFADDAFSPEMDTIERQAGDISVLVDLDESGSKILSCQSISPEWQVLDASLVPQALDTPSARTPADHNSMLLKITGTESTQSQDVVSLDGTFESQVAMGLSLVEQLEQRQRELRRAVASFPSNE